MSSHRIATRYAKSLIDLSREKGVVDQVFADMKSMDKTFEGSRELKRMFKSPIITADKKLNVVKSLFEGKISPLLYQFLTLMIKKGRESHLHETAEAFITQYNELKGITPVKLTSAVKLDAGLVQSIITSLKKKEKLTEVQLEEVIDESLVGGFVLQYGGKMIDASIRKSIHSLQNVIKDDSYVKKYY